MNHEYEIEKASQLLKSNPMLPLSDVGFWTFFNRIKNYSTKSKREALINYFELTIEALENREETLEMLEKREYSSKVLENLEESIGIYQFFIDLLIDDMEECEIDFKESEFYWIKDWNFDVCYCLGNKKIESFTPDESMNWFSKVSVIGYDTTVIDSIAILMTNKQKLKENYKKYVRVELQSSRYQGSVIFVHKDSLKPYEELE